jgi:GrpB-like predicted nucleotidyltransferase (UPF0157 family)
VPSEEPLPRPVVLVDPDPRWGALAAAEAEKVRRVLEDEIIAIHHIGSTAIPGIKAKPVLDFLVLVRDLGSLDANTSKLEAIGYVVRGEFGIPGRRYFTKDTAGQRSHQLHCFLDGDPEGERHKLFRDYLRAQRAVAIEYEKLKSDLALKFKDDTNAYAEAKTEFIRRIERRAYEWKERGGGR